MCKPVYLHYKFDINVDIWVILLTRTKWQDWWKVVHSNFYIKCFHCQTLMYKLKCFFFFFKHALTDSFTHHTHSQQKWIGESLVIKNPSIFNPVLVTDLQSGWVRASTGVGEVKKKKKKKIDWREEEPMIVLSHPGHSSIPYSTSVKSLTVTPPALFLTTNVKAVELKLVWWLRMCIFQQNKKDAWYPGTDLIEFSLISAPCAVFFF